MFLAIVQTPKRHFLAWLRVIWDTAWKSVNRSPQQASPGNKSIKKIRPSFYFTYLPRRSLRVDEWPPNSSHLILWTTMSGEPPGWYSSSQAGDIDEHNKILHEIGLYKRPAVIIWLEEQNQVMVEIYVFEIALCIWHTQYVGLFCILGSLHKSPSKRLFCNEIYSFMKHTDVWGSADVIYGMWLI